MAENKKLRSMSFPGLSGIYDLAPQWENVENKPEELNELRGAAIGRKGTAEGAEIFNNYDNNVASGYDSHAEGHYTTASGDHSHSEGGDTKASGINSHAEGDGTKATADAQHVQGRYNIEDTAKTYAHIVGNGTSSKRSNAHTVDWNGNANFAGDVYVGNADENKAGSKLATESFVTDKVNNIDHPVYAAEESVNTSAEVINADTLGGKLPSAFAPAGFGLGTTGKVKTIQAVSELDTIMQNGWYTIYAPTMQYIGGIPFHSVTLEVSMYNSVQGHQILRFIGNDTVCRRAMSGGAWKEWEFENPPMEVGVEYRTTERYNGKPVYVKTVRHTLTADTGSTSSVTTLAINGNVSNVDSIADVSGVYVNTEGRKYKLPAMGGNGNVFLGYNAISNGTLYLVLVINKDVFKAGQYFNVTFKYTKTTD